MGHWFRSGALGLASLIAVTQYNTAPTGSSQCLFFRRENDARVQLSRLCPVKRDPDQTSFFIYETHGLSIHVHCLRCVSHRNAMPRSSRILDR